MGLGKTFQCCAFVTALLRSAEATRVLVVAPTTLLPQWQAELELCGLRERTRRFYGHERETAARAVTRHGGVMLTTYGMVLHNAPQLDAVGGGGGERDHDEDGARWDWIVCDEVRTPP
jgi:SNF2 family DNA or RNA helicase